MPETYVFDIDFSIAAIVEVMREVALHYLDDQEYTIDLTTVQGDYHYDVSFDELTNLMHQYKEIVNSVTLSELADNNVGSQKSVVLYLNNTPGNHDISVTVTSNSLEVNEMMAAFIVQKIEEQREEHKANTAARLNDSFLFNEDTPANDIVIFFKEVSKKFLDDTPFEFDVVTTKDAIFNLSQKELSKIKNIIRKKDHHIISAYKASPKGSFLEISLFFEQHSPGFCYFSVASGQEATNESLKALIIQKLELSKKQMLQHKKQLINRPQLQGILKVDNRLKADQVVDSIEEISRQFMSPELLDLRFLTPTKSLYCYAENQCDDLRALFRKNKEGMLFATKSNDRGHVITLNMQFRDLNEISAYYYILMRSNKENETVRDFIIGVLGERDEETSDLQIIVKPQLQDAFSFDRGMRAEEVITFLHELSSSFLTEEIITVRLTTIDGEKHYFYDEEYHDLNVFFEQDIHDLIYVNLKENGGRSISVHLQFKSTVAGTNGYFSIVMNDDEQNERVMDFILSNLKSVPTLSSRKAKTKAVSKIPHDLDTLEGTFRFNQFLENYELMDFFHDLTSLFLPKTKMTIRVMTRNREEYFFMDDETNRLQHLLQTKDIDYLYIQKGIMDVQKLSLYLQFGEDNDQSGYFSIRTGSDEGNLRVKDLILGKLEAFKLNINHDEGTSLKGNFTFPETVNADRIIAFMNALVRKFLSGERFIKNKRFNFNIRNFDGSTHVNLDYNGFRSVFIREKPLIHILSCSSITQSGKYIELAFLFEDNKQKENGHFTVHCGDEAQNLKVRDYIFESFDNALPDQPATGQKEEVPMEGPAKDPASEEQEAALAFFAPETGDQSIQEVSIEEEVQPKAKQVFLSLGEKAEAESLVKDLVTKTLDGLDIKWVMPKGLDGFKVLDEILYAMDKSDIFIVDISSSAPSIWYELGLAHAQEKKIIILTENAEALPFDFKRFDHIIYAKTKKGLERLGKELAVYLRG